MISTRATSCRSPLYFLFCLMGAGWAKERAYLDTIALERDEERLRLLYESEGYPDASVHVEVSSRGRDRVAVTFQIVEGEPIRVASLEIEGLGSLSPPVELPEPLPLAVGDIYAVSRLAELERQIRLAFAERGHPYAQVEVTGSVDEVGRSADLVLSVEPGGAAVFGEAELEPVPPIRVSTVAERVAFEPGEPFRPSALEETERALFQLPIVEKVSIEPVGLEEGSSVISPRIVVEARKQRAFQVEGTVSSSECLEIALFGADRYFLGGPRLFGLGVGFSNLLASSLGDRFPCSSAGTGEYADPNYFVEADLRQPWPGSPRTILQLRGFYRRESTAQVYIQRGYGGQLGVAREFRPGLVGTADYSPSRNELRSADIYYCGNYGVCDEAVIDTMTAMHWLAPLGAQLSWQPGGMVPGIPPLPGERWRPWARGSLAGATRFTGSEYQYLRGIGEVATTRFYGTKYELAYRLRSGGLIGQRILPPQTGLYSGGPNTVRGVAQNMLGPKVLLTGADELEELGCRLEPGGCPAGTVAEPALVNVRALGGRVLADASLEGRVWVREGVQVVGFVDMGSVWRGGGRGGERGAGPSSESLITPGVGVRVFSPIGPVRVDIGYDPSGSRSLPLLVRDPETDQLISLGTVRYNPFGYDSPGWLKETWRRLQLQVGIGQSF